MRKRTIDKLLQAAIVEQAAEQGELWDREPVLEPIPEESQKRFDAALYGEPPKQTGAEDFFGQPAPKPAPGSKRRRVLAFALTGVSLAAVVLVVGLMIGVSRGEKGIKPDVLAPVNPDAQSTDAPPAGAGVRPAEATAPGLAEPTDTPTPEPGAAGESGGPAFFLNGKERNVYTSHYFIEDEETSIPLNAFLATVGAVAVDSPYNRYMVQCYEIQGIRYIYDWESQVFALEEPYDEIVQKLKAKGRTPTEADFREIDLFAQEGYEPEMQAETWLDHRILERVLRKMGLDISIEIDREANAIRVELAMPPTDSAAIPEDPEHPALRLKTYAWQGYTCLVPETFDVWAAMDRELSATEEALLMWDTDALEHVGLVDLNYAQIPESELVGQDLLAWYLGNQKSDDTPKEYDRPIEREIAPGVVSLHYRHRQTHSYVCIAKLCSDGTNALLFCASSFTKDGTADFDSIAKRFLEMNALA